MRGATVECIYCGMPSEREEIAAQGMNEQMGQHLEVVVLSRDGSVAVIIVQQMITTEMLLIALIYSFLMQK